MAYEVTATRKRPHKFEDLTGQEFVVSTLSNSIVNQRIAHAYLFSGPRGVGKTSAARILARSLNCEQGPTVTPCGTCTSCTEISRGSSMDVIEIDGASNTGVNDIREIKDEVLFAPNSSRYKVYIIDEVHMLSNSAFNALLKTIEEPPPYIIFIFATTEIHKVPATIRSRCQQFNFRLIGLEEVKNLLVAVCQETSIQYEEDALLWIAKEGTGSLRDSYTLFDQVTSFSDGHITLEKIREKLGLVGLEQIGDLLKLILEGQVSSVMDRCDTILNSGVSVDQFLVELGEFFRSLLLLKAGIQRQSVLGYESQKFDKAIVEAYTEEQILHGQELIFKLYREIRYSLNERFELELLLSRLIHLKDHLTSRQILGRIERLKQDLKIAHIQDEGNETLVASLEEKKKSPESPPVSNEEAAEAFFRRFSKSKAESLNSDEGPSDSQNQEELSQDISESFAPENPSFEKEEPQPIPQEKTALSIQDIQEENPPSMEEYVSPESTATIPGDLWQGLLQTLREESNMHLYSLLDRSLSHGFSDNLLELELNQAYDAHSVEEEQRKILSILKELSGVDYSIQIKVKENLQNDRVEKLDGQVELVRRIFQGQIVKQGGRK